MRIESYAIDHWYSTYPAVCKGHVERYRRRLECFETEVILFKSEDIPQCLV